MRRISFAILFLTLLNNSIFPHSSSNNKDSTTTNLYIGINTGLVYSKFISNSTFPIFGPYNNALFNFVGGINLTYYFNETLSIETGINYLKTGSKTEESSGTDELGNIQGKFWFKQSLEYIELPLLVKYSFHNKRIEPYITSGPNFGIILSGEDKIEADYTLNENQKYKKDIKNELNTLNISFGLGSGINYHLKENFIISLKIIFFIGFNDQIKNDKVNGHQKSQNIRLIFSFQKILF